MKNEFVLNPGDELSFEDNNESCKNEKVKKSLLEFPIDVLPSIVSKYIRSCEKNLNLIPDYMGSAYLSTISSMIGNSYSLKVKEGWNERPLFWMVLVGTSGMRKSPSVELIIAPFQDIDKTFYDNYIESKDSFNQNENNQPRQILVTDTTIEALVNTLLNNPNGVLLYKDELIGWINELTRYNRGSAEQTWLSIYSGQAIKQIRKTNSEIIRIEKPFVNVLGSIQPGLLPSLFADNRSLNGFSSRLLFTFPEKSERQISNDEVPYELIKEYDNHIKSFANLNNILSSSNPETNVVKFDKSNFENFSYWTNEFIYNKQNSGRISELEESVLSKLEAVCLRLALIFHITDAISENIVVPEYMSNTALFKAQQMAEYYYNNFLKVERFINKGELSNEPVELRILRIAFKQTLDGVPLARITKDLISMGYKQSEISRTFGMHRNTIRNHKLSD